MLLSRVHKYGKLIPAALGVVVAALAGCSSGPTEPIVNDRIFGVWEWVRAEGGIAGDTITPETEGFTMVLRITRPDRIELSRDGVTQVDTRFDFIPAQWVGTSSSSLPPTTSWSSKTTAATALSTSGWHAWNRPASI
jgi:hypothetical protein